MKIDVALCSESIVRCAVADGKVRGEFLKGGVSVFLRSEADQRCDLVFSVGFEVRKCQVA